MGAPAVGAVVLVRFPFSDLSRAKLRPAIVLAMPAETTRSSARSLWTVRVSRYFERRGWHAPPALYAYDFGDDWEHVLVHEGMESAEESVACLSGARRCPPEDCGGVHGYAEFLQAIADRRHPEHQSMLEWVGGAYDADAFDPDAVL